MKRTLVVFAAMLGSSVKPYGPLLAELRKEPELDEASAEFLLFDRATHRIGSGRLASFADELAAQINLCWLNHGGFEEVILFGHSVGGLLVREAYLLAWGDSAEPRFQWAGKVKRIVLLASPNRGVLAHGTINRVGDRLARLFLPWAHFTYQDAMNGSAFITNLRLRWIRKFRSHASDAGKLPEVIQLRGTRDDVVQEEDSADVLAFPSGDQVPVPGADHGSIALFKVQQGEGGTVELTEESRERYTLLRNAMLRGRASLGLGELAPASAKLDGSSDRVVFILHGIRARNIESWLKSLADTIAARDPLSKLVRPGYDYLSALRFVLPSVRRRNIRWLQDEYAQRLAENPDAIFYFIGHSNGTYMLGESLKRVPAMRFERVVLVGSVLPTDFFATGADVRNQVRAVRSDGALRDWPVGILCRVLRNTLRMRDVGTAGYDGFTGSFVEDHRYHPGGHSDMFTTENVNSIVDFVLGRQTANAPTGMLAEDAGFGFWSRVSPIGVGLVLLGAVALLAGSLVMEAWRPWGIGLAAILVAAVVALDAY